MYIYSFVLLVDTWGDYWLFFPLIFFYASQFQLNSGKVVAVGPGARDKDGKLIPVTLKEGETVLLPEYGGTEVKLGEKEWVTASLKLVLLWGSSFW